jgi:iron complex transport system substrate-binding protein
VQSRLPEDKDLPRVVWFYGGTQFGKGEIFMKDMQDFGGYATKVYRDLGVLEADVMGEIESGEWGSTDYEGLLELDPDVMIIDWGIAEGSIVHGGDGAFDNELFREMFITPLENHDIGSQLTAVQNGRVHPGPSVEQGPLINAFMTEYAGRLFFPEQFGEIDLGAPLDVSEENQLFDRQRVADIINGDI